MAKSKKNNGDTPKKDDEPRKGYAGENQQQKPRNPKADPVRIHEDFVNRRVGGGAPATREAYDRALEQWHRLPGAVATSPTEIRGPDRDREQDKSETKKDPDNAARDKEREP
jgi:hypothetical protein